MSYYHTHYTNIIIIQPITTATNTAHTTRKIGKRPIRETLRPQPEQTEKNKLSRKKQTKTRRTEKEKGTTKKGKRKKSNEKEKWPIAEFLEKKLEGIRKYSKKCS